MEKLIVPDPLKKEFQTVEALWNLKNTTTPFLDATILSWVKSEKQLRRLFSFLVYQHPCAEHLDCKDIDFVIAGNPCLYPNDLIAAIEQMVGKKISEIVGPECASCRVDIASINDHRNKFMHGQLTGDSLSAEDLQGYIRALVKWISLLAIGADKEIGYNGLERKTFKLARERPRLERHSLHFKSGGSMLQWIDCINRGERYKKKKYGSATLC